MRILRPLLMCAALGSVAQAAGRPTTVSAEGHAVMTGNRVQSLAQAKLSALKDAVGRVVQKLGGPAEGQDEAVDREIYARASTFVLRTTVLGDELDGSILNVTAQIDVDADALGKALG